MPSEVILGNGRDAYPALDAAMAALANHDRKLVEKRQALETAREIMIDNNLSIRELDRLIAKIDRERSGT